MSEQNPPNLASLFAAAIENKSKEERSYFSDKSCGGELTLQSQLAPSPHACRKSVTRDRVTHDCLAQPGRVT